MKWFLAMALWSAASLLAQDREPVSARETTQKPTVIKKPNPKFTDAARDAGISGEVWLEIVINTSGAPTEIALISPLGYGLDEAAMDAISKWTFRPGIKDGSPVPVRATIAVAFHLGTGSIGKDEKMRGRYNAAVRQLTVNRPGTRPAAIESMAMLAREEFPPAMFAYGMFLREGKDVAKDDAAAIELFRKAAKKENGPALYEIGRMHMAGVGMPLDPAKGRDMVFLAANRGSESAQYFLGMSHQTDPTAMRRTRRPRGSFYACAPPPAARSVSSSWAAIS